MNFAFGATVRESEAVFRVEAAFRTAMDCQLYAASSSSKLARSDALEVPQRKSVTFVVPAPIGLAATAARTRKALMLMPLA